MKPTEAIEKLPFVQKRAGESLAKVIKAALANAKNQGVSETDLIFKEIQIGEGPRLKRGRAASRGRWHPFKKRMAHIRVVLATVNKQIPNKQIEKSEGVVVAEGGKAGRGTKGASSETQNGTKS
jgi:large subunit ribosomal protein L22